jgi:hypothetical protein
MDVIEKQYENYLNKVQVAIMRPTTFHHKDVSYLESLLLYLTQECRKIFGSLIRCDYWTETYAVKTMKGFKPLSREALCKEDPLQDVTLDIDWEYARLANFRQFESEKN